MEKDKKEGNFLGKGWSFPPGFSLGTKSCIMVDNEEDIRQSLAILLSTRLGERMMQPDFGSSVYMMMFEKLDKSAVTFLKDSIESAILYHEPRIRLADIDVLDESGTEGRVLFDIQYMVRATNTRSNLVYPFYLNEATDLFIS